VATLYAGGLGMPDSGYYLDPTDPVLSEYQEHVRRLSALYPDAASAAIDPAAVVTVETALAQAVLSGPEAADPVATYHLTDLPTVASLLAHFPLEKYLTGALWPSSLSEVNLTDPGYVAGLDTVLVNLPLEALKSYLKWRVLDEYAETLGKAFVEEEARFHYGVFYGDSTPAPDWWGCQQSTVWGLGFALSEPFVSVRLHEPDRASAQALLRQVETAFAGNLAALSWLDEPTRAEAMAKLERVLDLVGYPDQWSSSTTASITRASYFGNVLALVREAKFNNTASLFEPVNRDAWLVPPCVTNAFYAPSHNEMLFPAAILQTPEFDVKGPRALNYGTMGSIMGHELSHGFDHVGRRFDGDGALRDWWTAEVAAEFERRSACLVEQYSKYQALPDLPLNGQLTLGENIADLAGLKLAYTAYRDSGGEKFAGPYGADQQFFLAYAQLWCANFAPELSQTLVRTDPHSPPKYRVNGVVSNLPEFARAFRCAPGSPMAPVDRCELW
jgi:predicted metalloendopeptidase